MPSLLQLLHERIVASGCERALLLLWLCLSHLPYSAIPLMTTVA